MSPTCQRIMDLFLANQGIYFTSKTAACTMGEPHSRIKDCMNILWRNHLLTKEDGDQSHVYRITNENMSLWVYWFRHYVQVLSN